jgi:hypothetical protein
MSMRRAAFVVLAACSGSSPDAPKPAPAPGHAPKVIRAGHSASIDIVAVTDDGKAAITQDNMDGTRLWPALDGSAEPIVVHAAAARELMLGRDGAGFVIATLDSAGALELVRIAKTGEQLSRVQIGGDVVTEDVAMTPAGVLALRADQTIALYAPDGVERAHLVPPRGERIAGVIARDGHALALVKSPQIQAREIVTEPRITWGTTSAKLPLATKRAVLSPDGKRIAAATETTGVAVIELATGKTLATPCKQADAPLEADIFGRAAVGNTAALGFVDDKTLACFVLGQIQWWGIDGTKREAPARVAATPEMAAIGSGIIVTADRVSLALTTATTTQWLGYGLANPNMVRTGPTGITLAHGPQPLVIDRALRAKRRLDLAVDAQDLDDVLPLDDTHVLVSRSDTQGEVVHRVKLLDLGTHKAQALDYAAASYELRYEPATHLLALWEKGHSYLVPLDPKTMHFDRGYRLAGAARPVDLVDPALARGLVAIAVSAQSNRTFVDEFHGDDVKRGADLKAHHSYEVFGDPVAVDRAGRVWVADGDTITAYIGGEYDKATAVVHFTQLGRAVVRPSPDATQVLVLGDNRIRLLDLEAKQRWLIPAATAIDVGWVDGEPFARFAAGLAKLDPTTGTLLDRVCGWSFGLSPTAFDTTGDNQSVCDAP